MQDMVKNGILEISHSPYVNLLMIMKMKDIQLRICVDARQLDKQMVPDRAKHHQLMNCYRDSMGRNTFLA